MVERGRILIGNGYCCRGRNLSCTVFLFFSKVAGTCRVQEMLGMQHNVCKNLDWKLASGTRQGLMNCHGFIL